MQGEHQYNERISQEVIDTINGWGVISKKQYKATHNSWFELDQLGDGKLDSIAVLDTTTLKSAINKLIPNRNTMGELKDILYEWYQIQRTMTR